MYEKKVLLLNSEVDKDMFPLLHKHARKDSEWIERSAKRIALYYPDMSTQEIFERLEGYLAD